MFPSSAGWGWVPLVIVKGGAALCLVPPVPYRVFFRHSLRVSCLGWTILHSARHQRPKNFSAAAANLPASSVFPPAESPAKSLSPGSRVSFVAPYQTRQLFAGYIGVPCLQPKALPNSSKFCTLPFTRHLPGECGSVVASMRAIWSVWFPHQICAKPIK